MKETIPPLYNLSYLKSLSNDASFLQKMIGLYLKNTPELVDSFRNAFPERKPEVLAEALHKLKSAAAAIGMEATKKNIEEMEQRIRSGQTTHIPEEALFAIADQFDTCISQLEEITL
ncbi:MAG: Hpt domain-containing protein [Chitinophagaceae bacterium]